MSKRYEELTIADDFMFCKIMTNHPEQCRQLAELALGKKVGSIVKIDKQVPVEITADGRGVRFDIYMEDDCKAIYNIEMQTSVVKELPFRTRYYQGMIDLDQMERGAKFNELKTSYIIFICLDNLFPEAGRHRYCFETLCREVPGLELGDMAHKIIPSTEGTQDDIPKELEAFLKYVGGSAPESDFTKLLDELVNRARNHIEWRKEYMTLLERDERMREEGRKEGIEEGQKIERANTEREAARADAAERKLIELEEEIKALKSRTLP